MRRLRASSLQNGFTIVELLVTVVAVGILASLTVVAYGGITENARNASMASGIQQYYKAIKIYYAVHGIFPQPSSAAVFSGSCMGEGYGPGYCWHTEDSEGNDTGTWLTQQWFIDALSEYNTTLPPLPVDINLNWPNGDTGKVGAIYAYTGNMSNFWNTNQYDAYGIPHADAFIQYVQKGLKGTSGQQGGCGVAEAYCFPQPSSITGWGLDVTTSLVLFEDGKPNTPSGWPYPL